MVLSHFYYKKTNQTKLNNETIKKAQNYLTQLMFYDCKESINITFNAIKKANENCKNLDSGIQVNNTFVVPCYNYLLDENAFIKIFQTFKTTSLKKLLILCVNKSETLNSFINSFENLNVQILQGTELYTKIFEPSGIMVKEVVKIKTNSKIKLNELKAIAFNKKNAKAYFLSGLFVMFASLFYRFSLYYQIFGTILFSLSLFSYFNSTFNKNNPIIFE